MSLSIWSSTAHLGAREENINGYNPQDDIGTTEMNNYA